ncbi:alpha/beta hydrolase fold domain-containing protein [Amycolatopsis taiwanensis]|uniref:Esterase n=1 Tax=Amycolatopsis taiwanensis TaxID=342230 RepID=A0A9W6VH08_9PSEU|nr:alpha/beta hydrolase [Amycolatopsis taiwanensis]GLY71408.1 esterase [Amycolatopsis taiwanensis]
MTSLHAKALTAAMWLSRRKRTFADLDRLRESFEHRQRPEDAVPPARVRRQVAVSRNVLRDRPVYTLRPRGEGTSRHVLYLHGGAYVHQIQRDHWSFLSRLVRRTGCTVTAPLYPLAPTHHCDETVDMVMATYKEELGAVEPGDQIVMGDSAGGALTLVLARSLRDEGRPQPKEIVLLSPWLDVTMSDPAQPELDRHDPYLAIAGLREAGRLYAGPRDPRDPLISPLNGELSGLGTLSLFAGTRDVLLADARRLRERARARSVPLEYHEYEGMFHAWMIADFAEARQATERIAHLVRR